MAKGARASVNKKNKQRLKAQVFGPVEQARAERLNKKLVELAQQPNPRQSSEINIIDAPAITTASENGTENGGAAPMQGVKKEKRKKPFQRKQQKGSWLQEVRAAKKIRVEAKKRKKEQNRIAFKKHPKKAKK